MTSELIFLPGIFAVTEIGITSRVSCKRNVDAAVFARLEQPPQHNLKHPVLTQTAWFQPNFGGKMA